MIAGEFGLYISRRSEGNRRELLIVVAAERGQRGVIRSSSALQGGARSAVPSTSVTRLRPGTAEERRRRLLLLQEEVNMAPPLMMRSTANGRLFGGGPRGEARNKPRLHDVGSMRAPLTAISGGLVVEEKRSRSRGWMGCWSGRTEERRTAERPSALRQ